MAKKRNKRVKRVAFGCLPFFLFGPFIFLLMTFMALSTTTTSSGCRLRGINFKSTATSTDSSGASDSDWTYPGSVAYENAKKVFDNWVSKGLSGGASAGIVGWVNSEGGFAMIGRAEGHYGNSLEENSIAYGNVPKGLAYYTTEAGGGIYQFTPYTKYAPLGDPRWEDVDYMNSFVVEAIKNGDWNPAHDMSGLNRSFLQMAQETDPQSATLAWNAYERGNPEYIHVDQKKADAQKAYDMFGGDQYDFDQKVFSASFGGSSDGEQTAGEKVIAKLKQKGCGNKSKFSGEYAHIFNTPYTVIQPYGYTPWSTGAGAALYAPSGGKHTGVDVVADNVSDGADTPVFSMTDGKVYSVSYSDVGGHAITIEPDFGGYLYYGHLKYAPDLKAGDSVKKGDKIAVLGRSGATDVYHVHLEYSKSPLMATGQDDEDPSFLFQKSGTLKQNQKFEP